MPKNLAAGLLQGFGTVALAAGGALINVAFGLLILGAALVAFGVAMER